MPVVAARSNRFGDDMPADDMPVGRGARQAAPRPPGPPAMTAGGPAGGTS
jgi:hypothetical protein